MGDDLKFNIIGEVIFDNNVAESGAGIFINGHSTVLFGENSNVKFANNSVDHNGAALFLNSHSTVLFDDNSTIKFIDNKATNGTIFSKDKSNVTFKATCKVTFTGNSAKQYGTAIYSSDNSHITFTGNATVTFESNVICTFSSVEPYSLKELVIYLLKGTLSQHLVAILLILVQAYSQFPILMLSSKRSQG